MENRANRVISIRYYHMRKLHQLRSYVSQELVQLIMMLLTSSNGYRNPVLARLQALRLLVHGQVTIIFVVSVGLSVCLFVCLCRVFLSRL